MNYASALLTYLEKDASVGRSVGQFVARHPLKMMAGTAAAGMAAGGAGMKKLKRMGAEHRDAKNQARELQTLLSMYPELMYGMPTQGLSSYDPYGGSEYYDMPDFPF